MNAILVDADLLIANINPSANKLLMARCAERLRIHFKLNLDNLKMVDNPTEELKLIIEEQQKKHDIIIQILNLISEVII